ncbi:hypothetical protein QR685DRAFT_435362 [Neurospora intermedia]|uniref:Uncharacterized protein n=1 Tax=Neurospora intermedia TaxID=5142 RepID=A0ABR3DQB2_NEUIN
MVLPSGWSFSRRLLSEGRDLGVHRKSERRPGFGQLATGPRNPAWSSNLCNGTWGIIGEIYGREIANFFAR